MKLSTLMHFSVPANSEGDDRMEHVFEAFRLNQAAINQMQQLLHLLADIQRHRACSMAILSGNLTFEKNIQAIDKKINSRLHYLDSRPELTEIIDPREWENVLAEWKVVGFDWRRDNVLHNFELHSHLLEKILNIIRALGRWILRSGSYSEGTGSHYLTHAIFEFIFTTYIYQIETLGRLRGLGTHAANSGSDDAMRIRIEYLLQCARQEQVASQDFFAAQPATVLRNLPALLDVQRCENTFSEWTTLMANIAQGTLAASEDLSDKTYVMASAIIDAKLAITEQILAYLRLAIEEKLESVLDDTTASPQSNQEK